MLTEIYCEAFGSQKKIPFSQGLNIIQGYCIVLMIFIIYKADYTALSENDGYKD